MLALIQFVSAFFRLGITSIKLGPNDPAQNLEQDGALVPNGAIVALAQALSANGAPAFGNWNLTIVPNTPVTTTYNANQMIGGIIARMSTGAAQTDSTDTATNIVNAIPGAKVNQTFPMLVANLGSGAITVAAGTGVSIVGTNLVGSATARLFLGQVTGSGAVTLRGCFGWNLGTGGTLSAGL